MGGPSAAAQEIQRRQLEEGKNQQPRNTQKTTGLSTKAQQKQQSTNLQKANMPTGTTTASTGTPTKQQQSTKLQKANQSNPNPHKLTPLQQKLLKMQNVKQGYTLSGGKVTDQNIANAEKNLELNTINYEGAQQNLEIQRKAEKNEHTKMGNATKETLGVLKVGRVEDQNKTKVSKNLEKVKQEKIDTKEDDVRYQKNKNEVTPEKIENYSGAGNRVIGTLQRGRRLAEDLGVDFDKKKKKKH